VRVARLGYPVRLVHPLFISQYRCLLPKGFPRRDDSVDDRAFCRAMGRALGIEEDMYQVGLTKVFFKKGSYGDLEGRRTKAWKHAAVTLQAFVR
jgi:myosin heavy chain 9/10/11/14